MDGGEGVALSGAERERNLMKAERWEKVIDLFQSALERAPEERAALLDEACHDDEGMRREVESLLTSHERAENFIEVPAFKVAPELATNDSADALVGKLLGHYCIESLIGVGGMGEVYLARDERLGRKAALKLLPDSLTTDETQLGRFKNEARTASALNHPNILTVYEIGAEGKVQFIATEFIEGVTLRAALASGRMSAQRALEIAVQVASALAAAHDAGVVHRDIKPENIMLRPDGYVKVLDFGIAKLTEQRRASDDPRVETTAELQTRPGLVLGTARYMSPEQTRGQSLDARSDIWSFGVIIYEMVGGVPPFLGETPSDCIASILATEPPPLTSVLPEVPLKLESILQKALRKSRDERYQTIKEMLADLRGLKVELEAEGSRPQTKGRAAAGVRKIKRHKRKRKEAPEASVLKLRDEMTRLRLGTKRWAIGVTALLLVGLGLALWQLRGLPELNGIMRQGVIRYPQTDVQVRALQEGNPVALQQEVYTKLGEQLHLDPRILREKLPQFAEELKHAPNASVLEQASANYVAKDYREAERLAVDAAREAQKTEPTNTKEIIDKLELAGLSAQQAIQYPRALQHFQEAEKLTDQKRNLKEWATVQDDIADLLVALGKYGEAEKRLRNVIEVRTAVLGAEHPDTLDTRHRLIYPLTRQTKYREAESEARQVLEFREKVLGSENVETIVSCYNLADTLADQGIQEKCAEAEALYRRIIPLAEKLLGPEHPRTVASRLGLATVLTDEGKNVEAEPLYRQVIKLDKKIYGQEDPNTLNDRGNLATALQAEGKYQDAEAEYRDVINLETRILGNDHPNLLTIRNNFAEMLDDEGKFAEAEADCRQLLKLEQPTLGPENRTTLNTRANLAVALIGQGKFADAKVECSDLLSLMERVLRLDSADTQLFTEKLARAWFRQSRPEEAIDIAKQAEDRARESLGADHRVTQQYAKLVQELQASN